MKKNKWTAFKTKLLTLFGGLLLEDRGDGVYIISLGRVAFWCSFLPCLIIWCSAIKYTTGIGILENTQTLKDPPAGLLNFLLTITGYNLTKKVADTAKNIWGNNVVGKVVKITNEVVNPPHASSDKDDENHNDI